ncbi:MAG: BON domain-containing protein [Magnetococcales bacterium]|nr:BON domain-containing protein [Magnetococcales bacterium]NGZ26802.1 BON domain-containing protein [Magnetococcales bacterium]
MRTATVALWLAVMMVLTGCGAAAVGGGAAATSVGERRGADDVAEDSWLAMKIRTAYVRSEKVKVGNVNVSVYRGKVLLTGTANSQTEINEAIRLAREVKGVVEVASELKVQYVGPLDLANDALITTKVKTRIMSDERVRGLDIHVETTKGVVYLTGEAASVAERDQAVHLARTTSDVREVVSYIMINTSAYPLTPGQNVPGPRSSDR